VKVEFARGYARMLYERELHDRLLDEVMAADPNVPGYTLTNVLAQRDADDMLASADDYFACSYCKPASRENADANFYLSCCCRLSVCG
jgi:hypothetical protein